MTARLHTDCRGIMHARSMAVLLDREYGSKAQLHLDAELWPGYQGAIVVPVDRPDDSWIGQGFDVLDYVVSHRQ